jgi:hypothetical protein
VFCVWDCRTVSLHLGPWNSFLPSSPKALRTYRRERPLLARKGNWREFSQQPVIHRRSWDFLHAPKLWHGTDCFTSPPKEGMLRIFSHRKKIQRFRLGSNPRTREPEASMLTTRPPKPSLCLGTTGFYLQRHTHFFISYYCKKAILNAAAYFSHI